MIAGFLVVSGLTGAVISWDHELDELLNPHLTDVTSVGTPIPSLALAAEIEARDPRVRVSWLPLAPEPGHALAFGVDPLVDPATGRLFEPGYNQVFIDPVTGEEQGRRDWGAAWPITSETFVSFLYVLHYSLHIPEIGASTLGRGSWAASRCLDRGLLRGLLPDPAARQAPASVERQLARGFWERWKPAWRIKSTGSAYRIAFDVHRAFSLWTWALLLILAFTAFSLNLYREVFYPVMALVSEVTPTPFDLRAPADKHRPIEPGPGYAAIIERGRRGRQPRLGGAGGRRLLQPGIRHLRCGLLPPRRRSRRRRRGSGLSLL